ncbi:response regulator transcription factor [Streptomyces thermocarboxydus]|uniref:response regulator n=1 Tax=Streptomyces TaxID=1883 RepID=UPI001676B1A4|nr:response regulator transcription factor [Streptomyces thermocarboxydus]
MIRFAVVDDHMIVHDGLQAMASRADDLEFVGAAETPDDALGLLEETRPDVLVLDLRLNGESSTELCATVRRRHPDVIVLMFSAYGNTELLTQAIRAGAAGYVLKDTNTGRMPEILRELVRAGSYFDPRIAGSLLLTSISNPSEPVSFSERELAIIRLIARGANNHDIGEALSVSPHTVKFHISTMFKRHGVHRRAELVRLAMDLQLLD